jgi:hypothetical protein
MTRVLSAGASWASQALSMRIHIGAASSSQRCSAPTKPVSARAVGHGGAPVWAPVRFGEALSLRFLAPIMKVVALTRWALCPDQP